MGVEQSAEAGEGLNTVAGAVGQIPVFGQILGGIIKGIGTGLGAGAKRKEIEEAERQRREAERNTVESFSTSPFTAAGPERLGGSGSQIGSTFGNMGSGVATFGRRTNNAAQFSVLGAIQNNQQAQQPSRGPEGQKTAGSAQQPQQTQDLPPQSNATPQLSSGGEQGQGQGPLGEEISSILSGLRPGGGGFYG